MLVHVQFSGADKSSIISVFPGPQDPEIWPNMGTVEEDDPRLLERLNPPSPNPVTDPLEKLKAFLLANPDVAEILQ